MQVCLLYAGGCKNAWVAVGICKQGSIFSIITEENNLQMFVSNTEHYWRMPHNTKNENPAAL